MYSPHHTAAFGRRERLGSSHWQARAAADARAASCDRAVHALFEGLVDAVTKAHAAMRCGEVEVKGRALGRAVHILNEDLRGSLRLTKADDAAADLDHLYAYAALRLTQANLHDDEHALQEVRRLIGPLSEAWASIASSVGA